MASKELTELSIANSPKTKTSVGMETADETVKRAKAMIAPVVSATELTQPTTPVKPPAPVVNSNDGSRLNNLIGTTANNAQQFLTVQSEEQRKRDELAGLLGTQTFDGAGQRAQLNEQFGMPANLARLTDIQTQLAARNEKTALAKAQATAGGAGAMQAERALTLADKQAAIRDAGLAAEANVLSGNIETASTLINQAMTDFYSDRQLQNQNMIQQLNYYSGIAEGQEKQLLEKEARKYEEDQAKVTRVLDSVDDALASGAATAEDMRTLTNPKATDEDRLAVAQSVIARGQAQMRNLDIAQANASIRASNASANRAEIGALLDLAEAGNADAISQLGLTQPDNTVPTSDEIAYARQYAATGQIPSGLSSADISFGRIQELAADLPKAQGTLVSKDTGVSPDSLNATERTGYENLYNAINTDLPVMIEQFDKMQAGIATTGILGGIKNTVLPSDAVVRYEQAKADFLAKLLVARSGAAVTEQEYERYSSLIPGKFNSALGLGAPGKEKLSGLQSQIDSALKDKLASRGLSIYGYSEIEADGQKYKVGEVITNEYGQQGRVNPDGSITLINQ